MDFLSDFCEGGGVFAGFEGAVQVVGDVHHFLLLHAVGVSASTRISVHRCNV